MRTIRVDQGERVRLFNTLAIETSARCNRTCVFCPVHHGDRPDEYMDESLVDKMLRELRTLRWAGRISPYIYNEPMRDIRILQLLKHMRAMLPRVCLMISTNGDYFRDKEDILALFNVGVNQLLINIYSQSDSHEDPKRREHGAIVSQKRHMQLLDWVRELGINQTGSVYIYAPPTSRVCRIMPKYGIRPDDKNLADYELQNRSGNIEWFQKGLIEPMDRGCVRPFRFLNINWRGQGILCCNDYHGETNLGNIREKSLVEIWNSEVMNRYRLHLQDHDRNVPLCNKCDYRGGVYPHMINRVSYGEEINT